MCHLLTFQCLKGAPWVSSCHGLTVLRVVFACQVITSAIGNEPPPPGVISALETSSMANTTMQVSSAAATGGNRKYFECVCTHVLVDDVHPRQGHAWQPC